MGDPVLRAGAWDDSIGLLTIKMKLIALGYDDFAASLRCHEHELESNPD
jgi:hypothetical protein